MKYQAEFSDLKNQDYKIEIITKSGSGTKELVLGESPFVTEMESDEDIIYSPIRTSLATINIVADLLPLDLFTGKAKDIKVTLTNQTTSKVEWVGYIQPLSFSQGFDYIIENVELTAIDGLSVLQYIPYRIIGDKPAIKTFLDIIFKCLKSSSVFNYLYISDNVQIKSATATDSICEIFRISESNFFEEADDVNQTLDDLAWNCLNVLTEISKFLGYTMVCEGDSVFMIDYDAIRKGKNNYWRYDISGTNYSGKTYVTISDSKYISDITNYSESGNTMSLSDVYNKVTVKDEFYTYEDLTVSFEDDETETNVIDRAVTSTDWMKYLPTEAKDYYLLCDTIQDRNGEYYQIFVGKSWKKCRWIGIFKFYRSAMYKYHLYTKSRQPVSEAKGTIGFADLVNYSGAFKVKYFTKEITSEYYNKWRAGYTSNWHSMSNDQRHAAWIKLLNNTDPTSINLKPAIFMINGPGATTHIGPAAHLRTGKYDPEDENEDVLRFPYVSLNPGYNSASIFGGEGSYIIIKGSIRQHDEWCSPYPLTGGKQNDELKRRSDEKYNCQAFHWCRLKWGDSYWNGLAWTTTPSNFKLYFGEGNRNDPLSRSDKYTFKVRDYWDKDLKIQDTAKADFGCDDDGYYIPAPEGRNLQGNAEFILYANRDMFGASDHGHWKPKDNNRYSRYYNFCQFITGFNIKTYKAASDLTGESDDSDTIYYNEIDSDNVMEGPEITFKVCTYDNKRSTYSMVDYLDSNNDSQYVEFTYNKALNSKQNITSTIGCGNITAYLRQEEHLVFKMVNQYENPRVILELNLKNDNYKLYGLYTDKTYSGKQFVPLIISTDYKNNKQSVKLIEKV